jgi:uncharacterized membrane protein required for colicin V production
MAKASVKESKSRTKRNNNSDFRGQEMNIVDVLIVGIIILGALQGYHKGLITGLANFVGGIVGLIIAAYSHSTLLMWLEGQFHIRERLEPVIYNIIKPAIETQAKSIDGKVLEAVSQMFPLELRSLLSDTDGATGLSSISQNALQQIGHKLSGALTDNLLKLAAFAAVFFLVVIIIQVVVKILLGSLGVVGGATNRGGGFFFGGLCALLGLVVVAGVVAPLIKLGIGGNVDNIVNQSNLYPYLLSLFQLADNLLKAHLVPQIWSQLSL